ncbi:MD-2-related lipid-recognition protein-like [Acyrthosiphon pisum]|uniref:MD-2-related lipid-recognition domain-containing protein n=1 Tax=Acyrthosiphon pisum TaxID=7029 RepID=A0A8R2FEF9_ACYPI|nr:MD-2-related lipid-recognition protein-like [Acyrthosiphon pisum]|eukprot:XP_008190079.1 PREDICTED: MD-2-related lipid-recognition protein-like [Acyrthosiphon pisum]
MAIFVSTVVGLMLAASVVNAEQVKNYRMCQNTNCDVYDLFVDPCPEALENQACELPQTENVSIAFKYKPKFGSNLPKARVSAEIFMLDLPFILNTNTNACLYTNCPVVKDTEQNWLYNFFVSKNFPRTSYTIRFKFWDTEPIAHSDDPQCCFKFEIKIV